MNSRLYRLLEKHQRIDEQLHEEQHRPHPDGMRLAQLKKLKLRIKDLIHRAARRPARI